MSIKSIKLCNSPAKDSVRRAASYADNITCQCARAEILVRNLTSLQISLVTLIVPKRYTSELELSAETAESSFKRNLTTTSAFNWAAARRARIVYLTG